MSCSPDSEHLENKDWARINRCTEHAGKSEACLVYNAPAFSLKTQSFSVKYIRYRAYVDDAPLI